MAVFDTILFSDLNVLVYSSLFGKFIMIESVKKLILTKRLITLLSPGIANIRTQPCSYSQFLKLG